MKALVLSGGGGKGAYQIGAWKAFKKLGIKFDIITGTSVGALNGALMAQNSYYKALHLWKKIGFNTIFNENITTDIDSKEGKLEIIKMYSKNIILNQGMNVEKLEKLAHKILKPKKIINSKINFGFVTFNLSTFKPKLINVKKINSDQLIDYLIASATCFPAFKMKYINGEKYLDGSYYDTRPINLAIEMGATEIISVSLKSIGIYQRIKNTNIPIKYIEPSKKLKNLLIFDKKNNYKNICYGYNDTMKSFGKLEGETFSFKINELLYNYNKYINNLDKNMKFFLKKKNIDFNKIQSKDYINNCIEYLGNIFEIPDYKIYDMTTFNYYLKLKLEKYSNELINSSKMIDKTLNVFDKKFLIKRIYFAIENKKIKDINTASILFLKETISALYLYTIGNNRYDK